MLIGEEPFDHGRIALNDGDVQHDFAVVILNALSSVQIYVRLLSENAYPLSVHLCDRVWKMRDYISSHVQMRFGAVKKQHVNGTFADRTSGIDI